MWNKLTFFKVDVSAQEWRGLFELIFQVVSKIRLCILRNGTKVEFYLKSETNLEPLNSKLYPFYLSNEILHNELEVLDEKDGKTSFFPWPIGDNLFNFFEKRHFEGKDVNRADITVSKFDPFRNHPSIKISYWQNGQRKWLLGIPLSNWYQFLAFDLSNSINSEITKVKPVLASNDLNFPLEESGILEIKNLGGRRFSTRSYDFWRHSLILGQSGSGKSIFIKLFLEDLCHKYGDQYAVILIDPHGSLETTIRVDKPRKAIDFKNLSTNLFINYGQPVLSSELTLDLFSTVLSVRENQTLARVLKYALNLLFGTNRMSLDNLKNLLTDTIFRKEILKSVTDPNIQKFFETEFQSISTAQYATAILPVLNLVSEMDFISGIKDSTELVKEINENFLVSLPIRQTELGNTITKIVGGAIIQQVFTIMQAGLTKKKVILIVDEVSVVQTPSLIHILSEARKFGLTVILSQQYLMQVSGEILMSVFANTVNYFCFKLARDDAETVARNLNCEIDQYFLKNKNDPKEMQELAIKLLTDLNPRDVIARVMSGEKYHNPFRAKTVTTTI